MGGSRERCDPPRPRWPVRLSTSLHPGIRATGRVEGDPMGFSELLVRLLEAKIDIGPGILWREIIGNVFGLASALLGMRRRVAAWPIGIIGNVVLFTVFVGSALGGVLATPQQHDVWGQAGRQVFFVVVSIYGWVRWARYRRGGDGGGGAGGPRRGRAAGKGPPVGGGRGPSTWFLFLL